jgi:hypothetical protein
LFSVVGPAEFDACGCGHGKQSEQCKAIVRMNEPNCPKPRIHNWRNDVACLCAGTTNAEYNENDENGYHYDEYGNYVSETSQSSDSTSTSTSNGMVNGVSRISWWMLALAAAAALAAMIAALVGSRKERRDRHGLEGSVARRMACFSAFADKSLCGNTNRPDRVVEMTMSQDDYRMV